MWIRRIDWYGNEDEDDEEGTADGDKSLETPTATSGDFPPDRSTLVDIGRSSPCTVTRLVPRSWEFFVIASVEVSFAQRFVVLILLLLLLPVLRL